MHIIIKEYRVENGLDTVALDTNRIRLAQEWAEYLDTTNQLYHSGLMVLKIALVNGLLNVYTSSMHG